MEQGLILFLKQPFFLFLFLPLFLFLLIFALKSKYQLTPFQRALSLTLRSAMIALLCLSLSTPELIQREQRVATLFLFDLSESISPKQFQKGVRQIETTIASMRDKDLAAIVLFGRHPYLFRPFLPKEKLQNLPWTEGRLRSLVSPKGTNIEEALSFSASLFPEGFEKRILLLTDGWENLGEAQKEAKFLKQQGITLWIHPLFKKPSKELDLRVLSFRLSETLLKPGEAVQGTFYIFSNQNTQGEVKIYRDNKGLKNFSLTLRKGKNGPFTFEDVLFKKGLYLYKLEVLHPKDKTLDNNTAYAPLRVSGKKLRVLLVEEREENALPLIQALKQEGIEADWAPPKALGPIIYDYDVLLLSDVPVQKLHSEDYTSDDLMVMIENYVKHGGGFVMIGGPNSFGLGGYMGTPIEKILPVEMDIPKKIEIPSLGMVLVIDKSGSMSGMKMELAKEAAVKVVQLLKPQDWIGVIAFDANYYWAVKLQKAVAKEEILQQIRRIRAGGGTFIYPALYEAYQKLRALPQAKIRHIILLTDGRTQRADHKKLCQAIVAAGITLSTVAVGRGADIVLLRNMARWGKGRFYYTENFRNIPRIFAQETMKVAKSSIIDEPFRPILALRLPFLKGLDWESAPELLSYVVTRPKSTSLVPLLAPSSEYPEGRPLLALWQYGLGKTAAFTSDAKQRWATLWLDWEGYPKFWSQLLRHLAKKPSHGDFRLKVRSTGEKVFFKVDALSLLGEYLNGKKLAVHVYPFSQEGQAEPKWKVSLIQTAPGRYEGKLLGMPRGFFVARLKEEGKERDSVIFSTSPPDETLVQGWNRPLLEKLGEFPKKPFWKPQGSVWFRQSTPLWTLFLLLALLLLPLDILVRRVPFGRAKQDLGAYLPMRPLEIFLRSLGALLGGSLLAGLGLLAALLPLPPVILETQHYWLSLYQVLFPLLLAPLGFWLGWKYTLRERLL